jgi:hypothetical protein
LAAELSTCTLTGPDTAATADAVEAGSKQKNKVNQTDRQTDKTPLKIQELQISESLASNSAT